MTVGELIELLRRFPQDADVVAFDAGEDFSAMTEKGVNYEERNYWDDSQQRWVGTRKIVSIIGGE